MGLMLGQWDMPKSIGGCRAMALEDHSVIGISDSHGAFGEGGCSIGGVKDWAHAQEVGGAHGG